MPTSTKPCPDCSTTLVEAERTSGAIDLACPACGFALQTVPPDGHDPTV